MSGTVRVDIDARTLEQRGLLRDACLASGVIALRTGVLVEDDAPAIGKPEGAVDDCWFERLHRGVRIRKELVLDDGRARAAWLTWCGREADDNDEPLRLSVNGVEVTRLPTKLAHPQCRHYYTSDWAGSQFDNWFVVPLPVGALRAGVNEIDLWADSPHTSWEVMLGADAEFAKGSASRPRHPDRSARSTDGGVTWDREHLGWKGEVDGEYCIRLSLDRFVAEGTLRSAAIDLAGEGDGLRRHLSVASTRVVWHAQMPAGTSVAVRVRFAEAPVAGAWSDWEPVDGLEAVRASPPGRWMQFEAVLATADPLATPSLTAVSIETLVDPCVATPTQVRLLRLANGRVLRSGVDYAWEDPAALRWLREGFELDAVVAGAPTEFEAMLRLMHWSYRIPLGQLDPYAWRYEDLPQLQREADGRIRMLGPYDEPRRQGHCLFCNLTLIAALLSFGYPARWVNISTKHTYGHEVTEVWSNDFDKWVFLDATRDYYIYDPETGTPLSLTEIGERVAEVLPEPATWDRPIQQQLAPERVRPGPVRVAYRQPDHGGPIFGGDEPFHDMYMIGHLQTPVRNDFSSRAQPVPWRLTSNWGSDLFCCWHSDAFPPKLEYGRQVDRKQDWEPRLNQAELVLTRTAAPDVLRVDVDTQTPWLEAFEARVDGEGWDDRPAASWQWALHEGRNRLEVRVRNRAGARGPAATAEVVRVG